MNIGLIIALSIVSIVIVALIVLGVIAIRKDTNPITRTDTKPIVSLEPVDSLDEIKTVLQKNTKPALLSKQRKAIYSSFMPEVKKLVDEHGPIVKAYIRGRIGTFISHSYLDYINALVKFNGFPKLPEATYDITDSHTIHYRPGKREVRIYDTWFYYTSGLGEKRVAHPLTEIKITAIGRSTCNTCCINGQDRWHHVEHLGILFQDNYYYKFF